MQLTKDEIAQLADPSNYSHGLGCGLLLPPMRRVPAERPRQFRVNPNHPLAEGLVIPPIAKG